MKNFSTIFVRNFSNAFLFAFAFTLNACNPFGTTEVPADFHPGVMGGVLSIVAADEIYAGTCNPVDVLIKDEAGNSLALAADTTVQFTLTPNASVYSDSSCAIPITELAATAGTSSLRLYFTYASGAVVNLTVTSVKRGIASAEQNINVVEYSPVITSVSPTAGPLTGGTTLTITGTNFRTGANVLINTDACTSVTVVSSTQITCLTPAHAAGPVGITVENADLQSDTLANAFTYQAAPTVTAITPSAGALTGGTAVTITGTNFLTGATVTIGGTTCTVPLVLTSTSITCTTGAHIAGVVSIIVTNTDMQSGTLNNGYTYQAAPTVTSISPSAGSISGSTAVTITGTGFLTGATISIGGTTCTSPSVVSGTSVTCTTGAHAAGAVDVVVTNTDSQSGTLSSGYTYQPAPTMTSISPNVGTKLGGTSVTITGTGFLTGATATLGGATCSGLTVVNATSITCVSNAHAVGAVDVVVTNSDNQTATLTNGFSYRDNPRVTSISPDVGPIAGGTTITLTGSNFTAGSTVQLDTSTCTSVNVASATSLSCVTPAHAAGAVNVSVTNDANLSGGYLLGFSYQGAPTVTSISPSAGALAGSTAVTITGTGFVSGATVAIGGTTCTSPTVVSATSITCSTGAHAAGAVDVVVTNADSQSGTLTNGYTYQSGPTVTSISPSAGTFAGSTAVTITGTGFISGATVALGGTTCTSPTVVSSTSITCTTGAHAAGAVDVVVTNPDTQIATLANGYSYRDAPTVSAISPNSGTTAGGTAVTVTGTNFTPNSTVKIGIITCTSPTVVDSTTITCTTGARVAGSTLVAVTNDAGMLGTKLFAYTYLNDAPTVTSISPSGGALAGNTAVTISGTGFTTGATVAIGGVTCTTPVVVTSTSMSCTTGAHAAGAVDVVVTNSDSQSGTLTNGYTYRAAPTITSMLPNTGIYTGGTNVVIPGTGYMSGATVAIGGVACSLLGSPTSTSLNCETGNASGPGTVNVVLTNPDGQSATLTNGFTYADNLSITSVSPSVGSTDGGTTVTITGTGFFNDTNNNLGINIGNGYCPIVSTTSTTIICTTNSSPAGTFDVKVTNGDGATITKTNGYTYQVLAPTVTGISSNGGSAHGGSLVTITGTGFVTGATVAMGGTACTPVSVTNATTLTCTTGAHAAGQVDVVVTNPDGQTATLVAGFTYRYGPQTNNFNPGTASTLGGTPITIDGTNFTSTVTVTIDGANCPVVSSTSTLIVCTAPAHAVATMLDVTVFNDDGQESTMPSFAYAVPPSIALVSPSAGPPSGGNQITIMGSGFESGASVGIGNSSCFVQSQTDSAIDCVVDSGLAGTYHVTVTNPNLLTGTLENGYSYRDAPTVIGIMNTGGSPSGGDSVTITGTDFLAGASVTLGGVACTSVSVTNATELTCTTGAHAVGQVDVVVANDDGQSGTLTNGYSYEYAVPVVYSISPSTVHTSGAVTVTITGDNFVVPENLTTVTIGGAACTSPSIVDGQHISCVAPAKAAGTYDIEVAIPGTSGSLLNGITYTDGPVIYSVDPTSGEGQGGYNVTITGGGLETAIDVDFGGVICGINSANAQGVNCSMYTAGGVVGPVYVSVRIQDMSSGVLPFGFEFLDEDSDSDGYPRSVDCDVTNAAINPGATETCNGVDDDCDGDIDEGLDCDGDGFTVAEGDCNDSDAHLSPGADEICNDFIDNNCNFMIDEQPCIDACALISDPTFEVSSPAAIPLRGGATLTLTGHDLDDATVTIDGDACSVNSNDGSTLTCTTPDLERPNRYDQEFYPTITVATAACNPSSKANNMATAGYWIAIPNAVLDTVGRRTKPIIENLDDTFFVWGGSRDGLYVPGGITYRPSTGVVNFTSGAGEPTLRNPQVVSSGDAIYFAAGEVMNAGTFEPNSDVYSYTSSGWTKYSPANPVSTGKLIWDGEYDLYFISINEATGAVTQVAKFDFDTPDWVAVSTTGTVPNLSTYPQSGNYYSNLIYFFSNLMPIFEFNALSNAFSQITFTSSSFATITEHLASTTVPGKGVIVAGSGSEWPSPAEASAINIYNGVTNVGSHRMLDTLLSSQPLAGTLSNSRALVYDGAGDEAAGGTQMGFIYNFDTDTLKTIYMKDGPPVVSDPGFKCFNGYCFMYGGTTNPSNSNTSVSSGGIFVGAQE